VVFGYVGDNTPRTSCSIHFQPHDNVHAQAVMGEFLKNQLEDPLLLYSSVVQNDRSNGE
jgi:hypothetical protein